LAEIVSDRARIMVDRLLNGWSNKPVVDLAIAGIAVAIHAFIVFRFQMGDVLAWADQPQRLAIYAAGAGLMGLIGGLTGNAITQYGSATGSLIEALRQQHGNLVRRTWVGICAWLLLSAVACVVAMAIDGKTSPRGSQWVFEFALAVAMTKFIRLVFLFDLMLSAIDTQNQFKRKTLQFRSRNSTATSADKSQ
jgi:hypothetical protein